MTASEHVQTRRVLSGCVVFSPVLILVQVVKRKRKTVDFCPATADVCDVVVTAFQWLQSRRFWRKEKHLTWMIQCRWMVTGQQNHTNMWFQIKPVRSNLWGQSVRFKPVRFHQWSSHDQIKPLRSTRNLKVIAKYIKPVLSMWLKPLIFTPVGLNQWD